MDALFGKVVCVDSSDFQVQTRLRAFLPSVVAKVMVDTQSLLLRFFTRLRRTGCLRAKASQGAARTWRMGLLSLDSPVRFGAEEGWI